MLLKLIPVLLLTATLAAAEPAQTPRKSKPLSIKGVSVNSNAINKRLRPHAEVHGFVVNKRNGSVGVCIDVTEGPFEYDDAYLQSMVFSFPQLRYDANKKEIVLGDQVVERRGIFRRWRNPVYKLNLKRTDRKATQDFAGKDAVVFDLYLETAAPTVNAMLAAKGKAKP